jgi:hypothetical protein
VEGLLRLSAGPFWELLRIHRNEEFVTTPYFRAARKIFSEAV